MSTITKKIIVSLSLLLILGAVEAMAEGHGGKHKGGEFKLDRKVARMQKKLNLTDEQADEVHGIFEEVRGEYNCRDYEKFSERKNCRQERKTRVKSALEGVLSEEQVSQFEQMRKDRKKNKRGRKGKRGGSE